MDTSDPTDEFPALKDMPSMELALMRTEVKRALFDGDDAIADARDVRFLKAIDDELRRRATRVDPAKFSRKDS